MPVFDDVLVTGSQTIQNDLQVNGNQTIQNSLLINGNQTIMNSIHVNGSHSVSNHLGVGGEVTAGGSVKANFRLGVNQQAFSPVAAPILGQVRYFTPSVANQPGLVLKGTDGLDYVLFVDTTGGTINLGIQRL